MHCYKQAARAKKNDAAAFKLARKAVFSYLEPQYQSIAEAANIISVHLKSSRLEPKSFKDFGLEGLSASEHMRTLMLVEDYVEAFVRDVPEHTRLLIRKMKEAFDLKYSAMERDMLLSHIQEKVRKGIFNKKPEAFIESIKTLIDNLDTQYLAIREARKAIFDHDAVEDCDCDRDIDLELWRCNEMMDWIRVDDPFVGSALENGSFEEPKHEPDFSQFNSRLRRNLGTDR